MNDLIVWTEDVPDGMTSLRGYLTGDGHAFSFEETVARLIAVSGQPQVGPASADGKTSIGFIGTFYGETFTLYDYKGDDEVHIGGTAALQVDKLKTLLRLVLQEVEPSEFQAEVVYGGEHRPYGWPLK